MDVIFADTGYWIALIDPKDKWHHKAVTLSKSLSGSLLLTTDEVLGPVLAAAVARIGENRVARARFLSDNYGLAIPSEEYF